MLGPARHAADEMGAAVAAAARHLGLGRRNAVAAVDASQPLAYELAFVAAESAALGIVLAAADAGRLSSAVAARAASQLVRSARTRIDGRRASLGLAPDALASPVAAKAVAAGLTTTVTERVLGDLADPAAPLPEELGMLAAEFRRFAAEQIAPRAQAIHRDDRLVPDEIVTGLAAMGAFGMSIPERYGGSQDPELPGHLPMVVATEELSRASLGAGGSLITRPEILARALLAGGTEAQRGRWLPGIASGRLMVAVAVTEPDAGSDVAAIRTRAEPADDGYRLTGTKMWCTFAGRAELLMVLARTDPDPGAGHRGLSLFVVEKPRADGGAFSFEAGGGTMQGRAIPTIGYRGMHSFEVAFDGWPIPAGALIGEETGAGRGFHLQMDAFAAGRLQTAARAVGLMHAALDAGQEYAAERRLFGKRLAAFGLTRHRLADMAARVATCRLFTYDVAAHLTSARGQIEASMVKALACRAAEEITRDATQLFGGYGYAEEYDVSRYFVDARVLSIFEGAEEVLALRVIARRLIENAMEA